VNNTLYVQSKDGVIRLAIEMGDDQVPEGEIIKPAPISITLTSEQVLFLMEWLDGHLNGEDFIVPIQQH